MQGENPSLQGRGAAAQSLPGRHVVLAIYTGLQPRACWCWGESQTLPSTANGVPWGWAPPPSPLLPTGWRVEQEAAALSLTMKGEAPPTRRAPG